MPQTIRLEDGTEQEVYTREELDAQATELAEARVAEVRETLEAETATVMYEQEQRLVEAQERLRKAEEKELNFKSLREKTNRTEEEKSRASEELETLRKTVASLEGTVEEVKRQPFEVAKTQFIQNNIGADKDLADKFDYFYTKLGNDAKTMDEVNQALVAAFNAASGGARQPDLTGRMTRTSVAPNYAAMQDGSNESQDSQSFGQMLGLSPEDKKLYGGAVKNNGSIPLFSQTNKNE